MRSPEDAIFGTTMLAMGSDLEEGGRWVVVLCGLLLKDFGELSHNY